MSVEKKLGRRAANCWGRPKFTYKKRAAAKAVRRRGRKLIRASAEVAGKPEAPISEAKSLVEYSRIGYMIAMHELLYD